MIWDKISEILKPSLPILGAAVAGPAGAKIGALISSTLGVEDDPNSIMLELQKNPEAITKLKLAELESNKEVLLASYQAQQKMLETVNQTIRNESNSDDSFVRRWRPFYGYAVAVSWFIQMLGITIAFVYTAIASPEKLAEIVSQFALLAGSLTALWGIALAVLGVSVHKRSLDKRNTIDDGDTLFSKLLGK